jgi:serine/threonine-protein kinase RsbW
VQSVPEIECVLEEVVGRLNRAGFANKDVFGVRLALEEAIVNAVKHGHRGDYSKPVHVRFQVSTEFVMVEVEDQGPGFRPDEVPDPLAPENLDRGSGRGLLLMRAYMSWVRFNDKGTCVTLCKKRR